MDLLAQVYCASMGSFVRVSCIIAFIIYAQKPPTKPSLCANQTSCHNHNDFLFYDVDLLPPKLEVTPAEVNLRSGGSVCVMYT